MKEKKINENQEKQPVILDRIQLEPHLKGDIAGGEGILIANFSVLTGVGFSLVPGRRVSSAVRTEVNGVADSQ